jgi:23S rRNA (uracil1939-C5)-methyltransferase
MTTSTVTIQSLGQHGEGVAEIAGQRHYVPFALPGEDVEISIDGDRGALLDLRTTSPDRITPFCPHFTFCGGCQLQHLGPDLYATFKRSLVEAPLARAGIDIDVGPLRDARGNGRRRATLHARADGAGFMAQRSHHVRDLDTCPILVPALAKAPDIARAAYAAIGVCDVGITATDTGLDVAIRAGRGRSTRRLLPFAQKHGLARLAFNGEMIWQSRATTLRIGKATVELPVGSFLQATAAAEQLLAELVADALGKSKTVIDLFCGIGPFALRLAETMRVTAADSDRAAIAALQHAARNTQGLKPLTAVARDLFRNPFAPEEMQGFDGAVFDPPRAGAEAQSRELARSRLKTIVAVSCDAKTFARDGNILIDGGYRLESVTPVDQFAWSTHVEIVGVFRR